MPFTMSYFWEKSLFISRLPILSDLPVKSYLGRGSWKPIILKSIHCWLLYDVGQPFFYLFFHTSYFMTKIQSFMLLYWFGGPKIRKSRKGCTERFLGHKKQSKSFCHETFSRSCGFRRRNNKLHHFNVRILNVMPVLYTGTFSILIKKPFLLHAKLSQAQF